jgi:hypothetical protein
MSEMQKKLCPKCEKNTSRRQMCGKCGKITILPCSECKKRIEYCEHCGTILI